MKNNISSYISIYNSRYRETTTRKKAKFFKAISSYKFR